MVLLLFLLLLEDEDRRVVSGMQRVSIRAEILDRGPEMWV